MTTTREYHPDRPYWLYRCYDADRALLYIGITRNPDRRIAEQNVNDWYRYIRFLQVGDSYPTWSEAIEAERSAVTAERPLFNGTWSDEDAILQSIAYVTARGHDPSHYQRRLARLYCGTGFISDQRLSEFLAAYERGERPGVQRIA